MITITSVAIVFTMLLMVIIFYESVKKEAFEDLRIYSEIVLNSIRSDGSGDYITIENKELLEKMKYKQLRVTIVDKEGKIIFDSKADPSAMDNHLDRSEVKMAIKTGKGTAIRHSDTLDKDNFYYAILLDTGYVLRVSKESSSVTSILFDTIPITILLVAIMLVACSMISNYFANRIIQPIERIAENLDNIDEEIQYKEILPLIKTIKEQHDDILKSAYMRQEFTANVSHELKTPLAAISGYAELIETGMATGDDIIRFAGDIHRNSDRLLTLINDILRISELDEGGMVENFEQINLYDTSVLCMDMLEMTANKYDVKVYAEGDKDVNISANKQMMEELVYNLCENAIRYNNPGGEVHISIEQIEDKVVLTVKDNGIGIPKEHQERVFERFYRVDKSRSKIKGGTGLGLAIVKHIVASHNAILEIESEEGKGTCIKVILATEATSHLK